MSWIIESLLDTDLYKFTMTQTYLHRLPNIHAKYRFIDRDGSDTIDLYKEFFAELNHLCSLKFQKDELLYLKDKPFLKEDFIHFLKLFRLQKEFIVAERIGNHIDITYEGPQLYTSLFETYLLSILSEIKARKINKYEEKLKSVFDKKLEDFPYDYFSENFRLTEMGTRRRASRELQENFVIKLNDHLKEKFFGTSNVLLAMRNDIKAVGTMAHEYLQTFQRLNGALKYFQKDALQTWADEYRGDLGIALTDTINMTTFLKDFDMYFAKLYDGARQDSGNPYEWGDRLIQHYKGFDINPMTKVGTFSNSLNFKEANNIAIYFKNRIMTSFGIGTYITHDFGDFGPKAPNFVCKLVEINGEAVAKVSEEPTKGVCEDQQFLLRLFEIFNIKIFQH